MRTDDFEDRLRNSLPGRYRIIREIGRGGMSVVYLARDLQEDRDVAIKALRSELALAGAMSRFLQEIEITGHLTHPNVLPLYDSGDAGGILFYVMPHVPSGSLKDRLRRERTISLEETRNLIRQVSAALDHAHNLQSTLGEGVVHRDVKPENILVTEDGHAYVADFGIARILTHADRQVLTSYGMVMGTWHYMSPEQCVGAKVDHRTDVYALGCVVHEMLAGEVPFEGSSGQAVAAKHISQPPPSLKVVRPDLPDHVCAAVLKALAKVPSDRFATCGRFGEALVQAGPGMELVPPPLPPGPDWFRRAGAIAAGIAVFVGMGLGVRAWLGRERLDPSRYVLAPFVSSMAPLDSPRYKQVQYQLESLLRRVPQIHLEESTRVNDQLLRLGAPINLEKLLSASRAIGAGRVVVLRAVPGQSSEEISTEVYDVGSEVAVRSARTVLSLDQPAVDSLAHLLENLFQLPAGALTPSGRVSDEAAREYGAGRSALELWNLAAAERHLRNAVTLEPTYAEAHYWLAKVKAWAGDPPEQWVAFARYAAGAATRLADRREALHARALLAMGEAAYPQACAIYDTLLVADSSSFEAWFGQGECKAKDNVVIPDQRSPSGRGYRASRHAAAHAYERALEVAPSFAGAFRPLGGLSRVLTLQAAGLRPGYGLSPDTVFYAAYASLSNDTLGYIPYPYREIQGSRGEVFSTTTTAAVDANRDRLLRVVRNWLSAFPSSPEAYQDLANLLELKGAFDGSSDPGRSALAAAVRARSTARTADDSLVADLIQVRLLVKLERFAQAAQEATSALNRFTDPTPSQADPLAGLAALTGRAHAAARLYAQAASMLPNGPAPEYRGVALSVIETAQSLTAYAAVGGPVDSLHALSSRLDALIVAHVDAARRRRVRCFLRTDPLRLAFPITRQVEEDADCRRRSDLLDAQWLLARADTAGVKARIARSLEMRRDIRPGDIALFGYLQDAWLLLQTADTAAAAQQLDRVLGAINALRTDAVRDPKQSAALARVMALRAEIAVEQGDERTARKWAVPVTELWKNADPELRPFVQRMTVLAMRGRPR